MSEKCTILVSSCDTYEDTWYPFFKILKSQWPDRPYPIVLNTESKSFDYEDMNIKTFRFYKHGKKVPWGKRLIKTLKAIDSEYIIFMLDDFFLLDTVDQKRIEECIEWMDADKDIAVFSFFPAPGQNIKDDIYSCFELRPQNGEYRLNCQAALWRRENLINYIRPHENPWQWEVFGSQRSERYLEKFYSIMEGVPLIFKYDFKNCGLVRGKWTESVIELFQKHQIYCDFSIRGFYKGKKEKTNIKRNKMLNRVIWLFKAIRFKIVVWKSLR